ncbi:MAG: hypothetical protein KGL26_03065 [Pseudomonadota bacterium]|nr:hypothetical protein [Pseudomonadota bacterium]
MGAASEPERAAAPAPAPAPRNAEEEPPPFFEPEEAPRGAAPKRPPDLIEFLASRGGLADDAAGDLRAMDAHKRFIPGAGQLVRKAGGMSLDEAREAAEEAGYLRPDSDINDLLGSIDDNLRGRHVFSDRDLSEAEDWRGQGAFGSGAPGQPERYKGDRLGDFERLKAEIDDNPHHAAAAYVRLAGRVTGDEHLVALDRDGRTISANTSSLPDQVFPPPELSARLTDPDAHVTVHHNHSIPTALSGEDIGALAQRGLDRVVAHGHDGHFSAAALTDQMRLALDRVRRLGGAPDVALKRLYFGARAPVQQMLQPEVMSGRITLDDAGAAASEIANRALQDAGIIDYEGTRPLPPALDKRLADTLYQRALSGALEEARRYGIKNPSRPMVGLPWRAGSLRPEQEMERLFGVSQKPPGRPEPLADQGRPGSGAQGPRGGAQNGTGDEGEGLGSGARQPRAPEEGQLVIPGAERSARQAAEAREVAGRGKLQPKKPQKEADEGLFKEAPDKRQGSLFSSGRQLELPVEQRQQARRNGRIAGSFLGKIFSPSTVGPNAERTAAIAREEHGQARRVTQQARATLEEFRNRAPNLGTPEGDNLMAYIEGRSTGAKLADPAMQQTADTIRAINKDRQNALRQLPGQSQRAFIEDYFEHMWDLTAAQAQQAAARWASTTRGGAWQGSGRMLKARTIPTYADGMAMGLPPKFPNIVDGEMASVANADRFISTNRILMRMKAEGLAREFFRGQAPDGWTKLKGNLVDRARPLGENGAAPTHTYAPEDAARVYNNMVSRGVWDKAAGPLYEKLLRFKNFQTMAELSFSAFHASTMATEAMFSQIGRAAGLIKDGRPVEAARVFATFPVAPVRNYFAGRKMAAEYLQPGSQGTEISRAMGLLSKANMSPIGRGESQYFAGTKGAFGQNVTQGGIRMKLKGMRRDLKDAFAEMGRDLGSKDALGLVGHISQNLARTMDTVSSPLFDHAIPRLKAGAALDRMTDWLNAHPGAALDEQLKAARDISDSIDNRFGELNYDNVFWHSAMKQLAFLSLRAFGWDLGTHREIEGGLADVARGRWSPRVEYLVGLGIGSTLLNGVATYLKTGHAPQSPMDLFAYDTGQKDDRGHEIRAMLPGYAREYVSTAMNIFARGLGQGAQGYGYNKLASSWQSAWELLTNRDYRDDPIGPPGAGVLTARSRAQLPEFLKRYLTYALDRFVPINWRAQLGLEPARDMRGVSDIEQAMAARPAPFAVKEPLAARAFFEHQAADPQSAEERWRVKLRRERRAARP